MQQVVQPCISNQLNTVGDNKLVLELEQTLRMLKNKFPALIMQQFQNIKILDKLFIQDKKCYKGIKWGGGVHSQFDYHTQLVTPVRLNYESTFTIDRIVKKLQIFKVSKQIIILLNYIVDEKGMQKHTSENTKHLISFYFLI